MSDLQELHESLRVLGHKLKLVRVLHCFEVLEDEVGGVVLQLFGAVEVAGHEVLSCVKDGDLVTQPVLALAEEGAQVVLVGSGQQVRADVVIADLIRVNEVESSSKSFWIDIVYLHVAVLDLKGVLVLEHGLEDGGPGGQHEPVHREDLRVANQFEVGERHVLDVARVPEEVVGDGWLADGGRHNRVILDVTLPTT